LIWLWGLRHLLHLLRKVLLKKSPTMNVGGIPIGLVLWSWSTLLTSLLGRVLLVLIVLRIFLAAVGDKFIKFNKAEKRIFMKLLTTTTYDGVSRVREHIMKLTQFFNKLRQMNVELADSFLVWQVLESFLHMLWSKTN
jgi:hypothetical protein